MSLCLPHTQTNKRRRTDDTVTHISDLPVGILVDVSAYLSKPSRAMLAVAFTAPSTSWQNEHNYSMHRPSSSTSKAIISSSDWDTLDFMDIEKSLANRLSDDDMYAVLQCINAQDVLKKLKLTGCINITGFGLNPLRVNQTVVLEQIDLSLLKQCEKPTSEIHHSMSKDIVLPILDSIISTMGCSLKYILLPQDWKGDVDDNNMLLQQFINRYNQHLDGVNCSKCTERIRAIPWFRAKYMFHYNTCYDCLKQYCNGCSNQGEEDADFQLDCCHSCKKDYCKQCAIVVKNKCSGCRTRYGDDSLVESEDSTSESE